MILAADIPVIVECRTEKPAASREYWSWREIDGHKCWYVGPRDKPKSELRWPYVAPRPAIGRGSPVSGARSDGAPLSPPSPPEVKAKAPFEAAWQNMLTDLLPVQFWQDHRSAYQWQPFGARK